MSDPVRLRDDDAASELERELLMAGGTQKRTPEERRRHAVRVATVTAPVGLAAWLMGQSWAYAAALAGATAATVVGVAVIVVPAIQSAEPATAAQAAHSVQSPHASAGAPPVATPAEGKADTNTPLGDEASANSDPAESARPVDERDDRARSRESSSGTTPSEPSPEASSAETADPDQASLKNKDSLSQEVSLLARAQSQLSGDPAAALATVDEHARQFPRGKLSLEREIVRLQALQGLGRRQEALAHARALLQSSTSQMYADRLRGIIASLSP